MQVQLKMLTIIIIIIVKLMCLSQKCIGFDIVIETMGMEWAMEQRKAVNSID